MSSYMFFYVVPKKTVTTYKKNPETKEVEQVDVEMPQQPLNLMYFTRSSDIYQLCMQEFNPVSFDNGYTEVSYSDIERLIKRYDENTLTPAKTRLKDYEEMLKLNYNDNLVQEILEFKEYIRDCEAVNDRLHSVSQIIFDICENYTDFESKILINYDY